MSRYTAICFFMLGVALTMLMIACINLDSDIHNAQRSISDLEGRIAILESATPVVNQSAVDSHNSNLVLNGVAAVQGVTK